VAWIKRTLSLGGEGRLRGQQLLSTPCSVHVSQAGRASTRSRVVAVSGLAAMAAVGLAPVAG
jgi:hypothetical protein